MPSLGSKQRRFLLCGLALVFAWASRGYGGPAGGEYELSGQVIGEQTNPKLAISASGGWVVWQDNAGTDRSGSGIAARRLDANLSPALGKLRVNQITKGWQENPDVALTSGGAAAIVWQGGRAGSQDIYLRILKPDRTFTTKVDRQVNRWTKGNHSDPVITRLANGNLAIAWSSSRQDGSHEGIYARVVSRRGPFVNNPVRANQFVSNNQRNPAISGLPNGTFVVVWASENQGLSGGDMIRNTNRVHIYGRIFTATGVPIGDEFRINTRSNLCARPTVAPCGSDRFTVAWVERSDVRAESWNISARHFQLDGTSTYDAFAVNGVTQGDQHSPKIAPLDAQQLVVWTSFGTDGSFEGVFGRWLTDGEVAGADFQVNTLWRQRQFQPAVAAGGANGFLVAWSGYMGGFGASGYDIRAQRYSPGPAALLAASPMTASTSSQRSLRANWTELSSASTADSRVLAGATSKTSLSPLKLSFSTTERGRYLHWNTEQGGIYQVQLSTNIGTWMNVGSPRWAAGATDSLLLEGDHRAAFYRVVRVQ